MHITQLVTFFGLVALPVTLCGPSTMDSGRLLDRAESPKSISGRRDTVLRADPMEVLEARMKRKFGVEARQATTTQSASSVLPVTVTVTSIPNYCLLSASNSTHIQAAAAQVTAMSMLASILSKDMMELSSPTSTSDLLSVLIGLMTANVSTMVSPTTAQAQTPIINMTLTSATLAPGMTGSTVYPIIDQNKSQGTSIDVGLFAAFIAAAGVAYCLA